MTRRADTAARTAYLVSALGITDGSVTKAELRARVPALDDNQFETCLDAAQKDGMIMRTSRGHYRSIFQSEFVGR